MKREGERKGKKEEKLMEVSKNVKNITVMGAKYKFSGETQVFPQIPFFLSLIKGFSRKK